MLGSTEVFGHETMSENVTVKGSPREVIFIILALYVRAAHETILLVCLGHIQKIVQAINELLGTSVSFVHPLPVHLNCFLKIKTNFTTKILIRIVQIDRFRYNMNKIESSEYPSTQFE